MSQLTIMANITAKADKIDLLKSELLKLIDITRTEQGCINYNLHQDNENSAHFVFYENWESRECLQAHSKSEHFVQFIAATKDLIAEFTISELTEIS